MRRRVRRVRAFLSIYVSVSVAVRAEQGSMQQGHTTGP